jgi:hypothetical protein
LVGTTASYPPVLLISISNAEAVLRDQLYNVDVLINRALVYASLTFVLAQSISGGDVARGYLPSTHRPRGAVPPGCCRYYPRDRRALRPGASFHPVAHRQALLPQQVRCEKTLEVFSKKLRDETDLDALDNELVGVVKGTMQPARVSLWLHPDRLPKKDDVPS